MSGEYEPVEQDESPDAFESPDAPIEYETAPSVPCEQALGFTALCASCPLVALLGDCPKALNRGALQPEMLEDVPEGSLLEERIVEAFTVPAELVFPVDVTAHTEQPLRPALVLDDDTPEAPTRSYKEELFDDSILVVVARPSKRAIIPSPVTTPVAVPVRALDENIGEESLADDKADVGDAIVESPAPLPVAVPSSTLASPLLAPPLFVSDLAPTLTLTPKPKLKLKPAAVMVSVPVRTPVVPTSPSTPASTSKPAPHVESEHIQKTIAPSDVVFSQVPSEARIEAEIEVETGVELNVCTDTDTYTMDMTTQAPETIELTSGIKLDQSLLTTAEFERLAEPECEPEFEYGVDNESVGNAEPSLEIETKKEMLVNVQPTGMLENTPSPLVPLTHGVEQLQSSDDKAVTAIAGAPSVLQGVRRVLALFVLPRLVAIHVK